MRGEQRRELPLARAVRVLREPGGPRAVVRGGDELLLEVIDAADDLTQRRARVPAQVVVAQRQRVDVLEQHREPVRGGHGRRERVDPGFQRLVAQQPRAQPAEGRDRQLVVGDGEPRLDPLAQRVRVQRERQQRIGGQVLGELGEALDERRRLARPGAAEHEQRAAEVLDGLALGGGRHEQRGHRRRIGLTWPPTLPLTGLERVGDPPRRSGRCSPTSRRSPSG